MNAKQEQFITEYIPKIEGVKERKSEAYQLRKEFVNYFTIDKIRTMSLEEYSLGNEHSIYNFSYALETMLKGLGGINGMSSEKFGVWFSPSKGEYSIARTYQRYGTVDAAFEAVRSDILEILKAGKEEDFVTFTKSRINEYVKAKILSVYYPDRYLSIFKKQTLIDLVDFFELHPKGDGTIYQREALLEMHDAHPIMKEWPVDIYCTFLWDCFIQLGGKVDNGYNEHFKKENKSNIVKHEKHFWIYAPGDNARLWDEFYQNGIMGFGWDDVEDYSRFKTKDDLKNHMQNIYDTEVDQSQSASMIWNFYKNIQPGDVIYAKKGRYAIVGRGIVESDYFFDDSREEYTSCRKVNWTHKGQWNLTDMLPMKTLTDITDDQNQRDQLESLFDNDLFVSDEFSENVLPYTNEDFLKDVFMTEDQLREMQHILKRKKNIILQGAPGVGKTFCAKRLAYTIIGERDDSHISLVQFHQNYSYEDFIMGYKPDGSNFVLKEGVFYRFCKRAQANLDKPYFFIIDEINRGNLSKIFGELLMLIENDYRGTQVTLAYKDEMFAVPKNLYIIGMMNTADRSLAMIDYALRRRFSFIEMTPGFSTEGFGYYQLEVDNKNFDKLVEKIVELNKAIVQDDTLGSGFQIGHSYLCNIAPSECNDALLKEIVTYDILPTLEEYWFDDKDKVNNWRNILTSIF